MTVSSPAARGALALSGAQTWTDGAPVDAALLGLAPGPVLVLPTGAAYERPDHLVDLARAHFAAFGTEVTAAMVLRRPDAEDPEFAKIVRGARLIYLCGGSPLHLRSVLKDSLVLDAMVRAWHDGATIAGMGAGAVALTDPMVDPRGGAFTVGLGLVRNLAAVPATASEASTHRRTIALLPAECALVELPPSGAAIRLGDGTWMGIGDPVVSVGRERADLADLAGKSVW